MNNPRLPRMPFAAYEPPPSVAPPAPVVPGGKQELFAGSFDLPSRGFDQEPSPELSVYKTQGAWRACDVYVQLQPPAGGWPHDGTLSVFVYALNNGSRSLVASGRVWGDGSLTDIASKWAAAARSVSQRYEVTIQFTQDYEDPAYTGKVQITVVAADDAPEPLDDVGAELASRLYGLNGSNVGPNTRQTPLYVELLSVAAAIGGLGAAGPRFLQLFDSVAAPVAGTPPLFEWPMGAAIGSGVQAALRYRVRTSLWLMVSSTSQLYTSVVDGSVSALVR